jgi:hypothetical protein
MAALVEVHAGEARHAVCPGCAEAHEWHLVQPGYGTLEQEPIGSGTGSVTWHCWQVIPAWFPSRCNWPSTWSLRASSR